MIAIGGWGDTAGFSIGASSAESRALFAKNVKTMLIETGADGVGKSSGQQQLPSERNMTNFSPRPKILIGSTQAETVQTTRPIPIPTRQAKSLPILSSLARYDLLLAPNTYSLPLSPVLRAT